MAHCVTHGITFDPQWEWCIYCGKPKTAELVVVENTSTNSESTQLLCSTCRRRIDNADMHVHRSDGSFCAECA
jgi:hypothetical protein